jgi:hypothetical protein
MSFPETPQDYFEYFHLHTVSLPLHAKLPDPKWQIGLEAAQRWREYRDQQGDTAANAEALISLIKFFMPHRREGSGFAGLWANILGDINQLPIKSQIQAWFEIFDVSNQGERTIEFSERSRQILQQWLELVDAVNVSTRLNPMILEEMAEKIYLCYCSGVEGMALTNALNNWFKVYIDKPSLLECVHTKGQSGKSV